MERGEMRKGKEAELIIVVRIPETLTRGSNNTMQVAKSTGEPQAVSAG